MALRTRAALDALVSEWLDDPNNARWSAANVKAAISMVYDQLWSEMLEIDPMLNTSTLTITSLTAPGYISVADGGALDPKRLHRLQKIFRDGREYRKGDANDYVIDYANSTVLVGPDRSYIFFGNQLWLFPLDETTDVDVTFSWIPEEYEDLEDAEEITWPMGHDLALVLEAAAFMITKGATEDPTPILLMAERAKNRMFSALRKRWRGAVAMKGDSMFDDREFGGNG